MYITALSTSFSINLHFLASWKVVDLNVHCAGPVIMLRDLLWETRTACSIASMENEKIIEKRSQLKVNSILIYKVFIFLINSHFEILIGLISLG